MMDADVLAMVRVIASELDTIDDNTVLQYIDFAKTFVSERRFGPMYEKALAFYAAHLLTLKSITAANGATDAALTAGAVTSEREGDLQRTYDYSSGSSSSLLSKTVYGKQYLELLKMCIVPVITRRG